MIVALRVWKKITPEGWQGSDMESAKENAFRTGAIVSQE